MNSTLKMARGSLLCDYANRNSCLAYRPDSPTTITDISIAAPDILVIAVMKGIVLTVHMKVYHAQSSDHLPVLIYSICRALFHDPLDRPNFSRTDWATIQASFEARLLGNLVVHDEEAFGKCVVGMTSAIQVALTESTIKRRPCTDP
jgi:hypothetical protein